MHGINDAQVTAEVVNLIENEAPDFTFVHLDEPDGAGHSVGFGDKYNQSMVTASEQVGQILDAVEVRGTANPDEDWMVIVSTDHGRDAVTGFNHGGQTYSERQTFIASNEELETFDQPVPATSVVTTVLDHLGIPFDLTELESGSLLEGAPAPLPPLLAAILDPEDDKTFVALDTDLSVQFSEDIQAGTGFVHIVDVVSDTVMQSVDITADAVTIAGDTLTVDLPEELAPGTRYAVNIDAGAVTDLPSGAEGVTNAFGGIDDNTTWDFVTDEAASLTNVFFEDWESLAGDLGPYVSDTEGGGGGGTDWTSTFPNGWTMVNNVPEGGPAEFFGWTFHDVDAWNVTAGDQRRSEFTNGEGVVAVADPDEYDDGATGIDPDLFDATLVSPVIDLAPAGEGDLTISFDSSWRPEDAQEAAFLVSFDGGEQQEIFRWSSDSADANYEPDSVNERVSVSVERPEGAGEMQLSFDKPQGGNDWWWAVDNIEVEGAAAAHAGLIPVTVTFKSEDAGFANAFGIYDTETMEAELVAANLNDTTADEVVFSDMLTQKQADNLGFFLLPNGDDENVDLAGIIGDTLMVVDTADGYVLKPVDTDAALGGLGAPAFFSDPDLNPGGLDQFRGGEESADDFMLEIEDLPGGGDLDFNDAVFQVQIGEPATSDLLV